MTNLKNLSVEELQDFIKKLGYKEYRAEQILNWIYVRGAEDFDKMTNLSKKMQIELNKQFVLPTLPLVGKIESNDGSIKYLWELHDGGRIESVYIPEKSRKTVCISTQVGCGMGCSFCATGKLGLDRNLEEWEIIEQVLSVQKDIRKRITNVVLMGMGEPLANTEKAIKAIYRMNELMQIGARKITLSTAGIVPEIYKISRIPIQFRLAISLNATTDELRSELMPINKKYPINELLQAGSYYAKKKHIRVTLEYIIFKGLNDRKQDAIRLANLSLKLPSKINLIPYNPVDNLDYKRPEDKVVERFKSFLHPVAPAVTIRWSKGRRVGAACGQLRGEN